MSPFPPICGLSLRGEKECKPPPRICFDDEAFASPSTRQALRGHALNRRPAARVPSNTQVGKANRRISDYLRQIRQSSHEPKVKWPVPNLRSGSGGDLRPLLRVSS